MRGTMIDIEENWSNCIAKIFILIDGKISEFECNLVEVDKMIKYYEVNTAIELKFKELDLSPWLDSLTQNVN
jgi:hypothetical protein